MQTICAWALVSLSFLGGDEFAPISKTLETGTRFSGQIQVKAYRVRTTDGVSLVLRRAMIADKLDVTRLPVLLWPDVGMSSQFFDLNPRVSLAAFLVQQGFDVWFVDPRGSGLSERFDHEVPKSEAWSTEPAEIPEGGYRSAKPESGLWGIEEHVDHDLPAALAFACYESGIGQVTMLAHGMGGTVALAHLARFGTENRIGRLVIVSGIWTQAANNKNSSVFENLANWCRDELEGSPTGKTPGETLFDLFASPEEGISDGVRKSLFLHASFRTSPVLARQCAEMFRSGRFSDLRGALMDRIPVGGKMPCLVLVGAKDRTISVEEAVRMSESLPTPDRTVVVADKKSGFSRDFGHYDVLLGEEAREEIFPMLELFLKGQAVGKRKPASN